MVPGQGGVVLPLDLADLTLQLCDDMARERTEMEIERAQDQHEFEGRRIVPQDIEHRAPELPAQAGAQALSAKPPERAQAGDDRPRFNADLVMRPPEPPADLAYAGEVGFRPVDRQQHRAIIGQYLLTRTKCWVHCRALIADAAPPPPPQAPPSFMVFLRLGPLEPEPAGAEHAIKQPRLLEQGNARIRRPAIPHIGPGGLRMALSCVAHP